MSWSVALEAPAERSTVTSLIRDPRRSISSTRQPGHQVSRDSAATQRRKIPSAVAGR